MDALQVTALTGAFDPSSLVDTLILFAPFILAAVAIVVGIAIAKGAFRKVTRKVSGGIH